MVFRATSELMLKVLRVICEQCPRFSCKKFDSCDLWTFHRPNFQNHIAYMTVHIMRHYKSELFCAVTIILLNTLRWNMAKKSLNMLIKWVKLIKIMNFLACKYKSPNFAQIQRNFRRRTTVRLWHLETLHNKYEIIVQKNYSSHSTF